MVYTIVPTKQTGDSLSAKEYNAYIKDNFAASVPDIFTAKGDIAVATAEDTAARRSVGTNKQLLKVNSNDTTGMDYQWFSGALAHSSSRTIATDTLTVMRYNTEVYDVNTAQTAGSGNDYIYTLPSGYAGYYLVGCSIEVGGNASMEVNEYLKISIRVNSTIVSSGAQYFQAGNTSKIIWLWDILKVSGGTPNQIEVVILQNSGADVTAGNDRQRVFVTRLLGG